MKTIYVCYWEIGRKALHPDMGYMKGLSSDVNLSGLGETFQVKKKSENREYRKM